MKRILALVLFLIAVPPAEAADLIEPWAPGLSDLELAFAGAPGGRREASTVLGGGLTDRLSVGLLAGTDESEERSLEALLLYSQPLGRAGVLDLWCQTSLRRTRPGTGCGLEWSRELGAFVPYTRLEFDGRRPAQTLVPLVGLLLPLHGNLGLHLELSLEQEEAAGRPLHLAVGPNWALLPRLELLPELAWTRSPQGEDSFDLTLCFVFDVSR